MESILVLIDATRNSFDFFQFKTHLVYSVGPVLSIFSCDTCDNFMTVNFDGFIMY